MEASEIHEKSGETICSRCQQLSLEQYIVEDGDPGPAELGGFQEISQRTGCSFCRLIISALSTHSQDYWKEKIYPVEKCYFGRTRDTSGASRLVTWFDATSSTLPLGISGHMTTYGEILVGKESSLYPRNTQTGLARVVGESCVDFSLIRKWISSCEEHHAPVCGLESYKPTQIRLLDIHRMCLVSGYHSYRYFALSYVWGSAATFWTLQSNISELEEEGSISRIRKRLPRSINDAITLVSALQEQFLWVDALCIVQDDEDDKRTHIPNMDLIYSQAAVTIVSLSGQDANAGLPGIQEGSRKVQQRSEIVKSWRLFAKLPELSVTLQKSKWNTRAWTFQEGILSRRRLFFSDDQVYFQCQSGYFTEDSYGDQTRPEWRSGFSNPFNQRDVTKTEDLAHVFNIYNNTVKSYSRRQHTYHFDSLNAFRGVLSSFSTSFGWKFTSALPEELFDIALLWRPMFTAKLRSRGFSDVPRDRGCTAPTWCWASWIGDIYWDPWRTNSYVGKIVSLEPAVQQFCLASSDGYRSIGQREGSLDSDSLKTIVDDANRCSSALLGNPDGETKSPWNMVLFFRASTTDLSNLSILSSSERHEKYQCISSWLKRTSRHDAWICDNNGLHCGTLYGLESTWKDSHNPDSFELVLLSTFNQQEVMQTDIDARRDSLPLEFPSSDDYYQEIFDTAHYKYTKAWACNIMLIEWIGKVAMRVAVGKNHVDAWAGMKTCIKTISLV